MREKIDTEITLLTEKIERMKQDLVLADGALQAFRYMRAQLEDSPPDAQVEADVAEADVAEAKE